MLRDEIGKAVKEGRIVIGTDRVIKGMKDGAFEIVIYASNIPEDTLKEINYYTNNFKIKTEKFNGTSKQLGEICGKPFNILMIGILPKGK